MWSATFPFKSYKSPLHVIFVIEVFCYTLPFKPYKSVLLYFCFQSDKSALLYVCLNLIEVFLYFCLKPYRRAILLLLKSNTSGIRYFCFNFKPMATVLMLPSLNLSKCTKFAACPSFAAQTISPSLRSFKSPRNIWLMHLTQSYKWETLSALKCPRGKDDGYNKRHNIKAICQRAGSALSQKNSLASNHGLPTLAAINTIPCLNV